MTRMSRTTIMAPNDLLDQLRAIASEEGLSLGEVIRQGLEWRAEQRRRRPPSFIGAVESDDGPGDTSERVDEILDAYYRSGDAHL
jgi:hypothetical protein